MAIIPRLPAAANPLEVTITINTTILPYFTQWYNSTKKVGETPEEFGLRVWKEAAKLYYLKNLHLISDYVEDYTSDEATFENEF